MAGQKVWFTFTIKSLTVTNTPELTDDFVKENFASYDLKDVEGFEKYEKNQLRISNISNAVWADFFESSQVVSYNEDLLKEMIKQYNAQGETVAANYGASFEDYLEACSMSQEQWDEQADATVKSTMKTYMVIEALAKLDGYELSEDDYNKQLEAMAKQNSTSTEEIESYYDSSYGKGYLKVIFLSEKSSMQYFADNVTIKKGSNPNAETTEETTAE